MKRVIILAILALAITSCTRVGPGYVGIKVSMAGSDKGVQDLPATTGWVFYNPLASSVFEYPTFVQNVVWTHSVAEGNPINEEITFSNADQMQIAVDINLSYQLSPQKIPAFYVKFRNDSLPSFSNGFLRAAVRDALNDVGGKYHIEQIMGDNTDFLKQSRAVLQASLDPLGVEIVQFGLIGIPRPPQAVIEAINNKVHATQLAEQKQNELMQVKADAAKRVAETEGYAQSVLLRADAESEANRKVAASLTPELVRLRALEKWNGTLPTMTGGAIPFVNVER